MACNSLEGIEFGCSNNQGGIYNLYVNDTDSVSGITLNAAQDTITAMTASTSFENLQFRRNTGNVNVVPTVDLINGSTYFDVTVTLVFHRREAAKSRALYILGEGQRYLDFIFLDANGIYWFIDHAQLTGGPEDTGTVKADGSKYTVEFKAQMDTRPYAVSSSIVPALIA